MLQVLKGSFGANRTYWSTQPAAKGIVIFFPGDQLEHALAAPEIRHLQDPKIQAQLIAAKFQGCSSVVVMPSRLEGSYACFDHFLEQITRSGEPLGYPATQLKATSQITSLLKAGLPADSNTDITYHLVGFSKGTALHALGLQLLLSSVSKVAMSFITMFLCSGGVVLNQVLCEAAYCWEQSQAPTGKPVTLTSEVTHFLQNLAEVHFLDAGLNCRGAHVTDPQVITSLSRYVQQDSRRMTIHLHGTPRQWDDSRRPWVEQEKERFRILLESNSLPVQEHRYFTGVEPTLLMHFEVIPAMRRCQLSV